MTGESKFINVIPGTWGTVCRLYGKRYRKCTNKPRFMIFGEDGRPKMSRLEGCVCADHLASAVKNLRRRQLAGKDVPTV